MFVGVHCPCHVIHNINHKAATPYMGITNFDMGISSWTCFIGLTIPVKDTLHNRATASSWKTNTKPLRSICEYLVAESGSCCYKSVEAV